MTNQLFNQISLPQIIKRNNVIPLRWFLWTESDSDSWKQCHICYFIVYQNIIVSLHCRHISWLALLIIIFYCRIKFDSSQIQLYVCAKRELSIKYRCVPGNSFNWVELYDVEWVLEVHGSSLNYFIVEETSLMCRIRPVTHALNNLASLA